MMKRSQSLDIITAVFTAVLIISNIVSVKIVKLGPLTFDGGTLIFPLTYIFGDVLTEVYGYSKARRTIWIGFFSCLLMSVVFFIVGMLPSDSGWAYQQSYNDILGVVPRIVLASLIAYLFGEFSNSFVLSRMKVLMKGKFLFMRTIGSTLVGQVFDTGLFVAIAFAGIYDSKLLAAIAISNYVFKVGVEILMTPLTYAVTGFLKKKDEADVYDVKVSYNPFSSSSD